MSRMSRRTFLSKSSLAATGAAVGTFAVATGRPRRVLGANERINVGLIGCGGRGRYNAYGMAELGARVTHLCDVQPNRRDQTAEFLAKVQDEKPRLVNEMERLFEAKDVDAILVATPDHWHAPATIRACQAGKDVYCEKPASHSIWESRKMLEAARKYKRIVQIGTQNRSGPYVLKALEYIKSGKLGEIPLVRVFNMKPGGPFHLGEAGTKPEGFDWDRWLGRAAQRPYHKGLVSHGWLYLWDFCNGDMGNDGIHQIDLALMLMGDPGMPKSVRTLGGRYAYPDDDAEVPDVQMASFDFGDFVMTFELTGYPRYMRKTTGTIRRNDEFPYWTQNATRIEFYGSELMMIVGRHGGGWVAVQSGGREVEKVYGRPCDEPHYKNFLDCIKSRRRPTADMGLANDTCCTMHMGNIAHRVGNVALNYDPKTGTFDNDAANRLIKAPYRKGYELPEEV